MDTATPVETHGFQTEINQLLDLFINSLYSNKEIFLRELISNASDANDKLRYLAISDNTLYESEGDLKIWIRYDEKARTITISDNGIGMDRDDLINNLGTIARSGTKEFFENLSQSKAKSDADTSNLIGQFGVGFYSAFIISDSVTVHSRKAGTHQGIAWHSEGKGEYTLSHLDKKTRGTDVTLHLKADEDEFLSDWRLKRIINKYSDHISWPVMMAQPESDASNATDKADEKSDADTAKKTEAVQEKSPKEVRYEQINKATALWMRAKNKVSDEEYKTFYKHLSHDNDDPCLWTHNRVEGKNDYTTLLFIPKKAPFDLWHHEFQRGLKLYKNRVFILDRAEQFLPRYLRFVKGIVDAKDLPLNVSREILQENKLVDSIRNGIVKRVLGLLEKLATSEPEDYQNFWDAFGLVLKEGPVEDFSNREQISKLLRFSSTKETLEKQNVSLEDYVSRMKSDQTHIYYITAESFNAAKGSPHLEVFKERDIEVLLMFDKIDEWAVNHLNEFKDKKLQSITKGEVDLGQNDQSAKEETEALTKAMDSVLKQMEEVLANDVKSVRLTHRLTTSPACIVADENDMGREMQRILQQAGQAMPASKPILELNPKHKLITQMQMETDDEKFSEWSHLILDQALLAESGKIDNPGAFVNRMNRFLSELVA